MYIHKKRQRAKKYRYIGSQFHSVSKYVPIQNSDTNYDYLFENPMSSDRFQRILIDLNAPLKNLVKSADHYVARSEQHEQKRWPVALAHWNRLSSVCSGPKSCCLESMQSLNFRFHILLHK